MLTNDKPQNLNEIIGVEDLDNENAAAVSGGFALLTTGTLFRGGRRVLSGKPGTIFNGLRPLNNRVSSIGISPGERWRFWVRRNRRGRSRTFGPGVYNLIGSDNNNFASAQRVG